MIFIVNGMRIICFLSSEDVKSKKKHVNRFDHSGKKSKKGYAIASVYSERNFRSSYTPDALMAEATALYKASALEVETETPVIETVAIGRDGVIRFIENTKSAKTRPTVLRYSDGSFVDATSSKVSVISDGLRFYSHTVMETYSPGRHGTELVTNASREQLAILNKYFGDFINSASAGYYGISNSESQYAKLLDSQFFGEEAELVLSDFAEIQVAGEAHPYPLNPEKVYTADKGDGVLFKGKA